MTKFLISSAAAVLLLSAGAANAGAFDNSAFSAPYVSVLGGWSSHPALSLGSGHFGVDDGYNVGARIGTDLDVLPNFSLEADYFHNSGSYTGTNVDHSSDSYMGNLIYHLPMQNSPVGLYGGAGIGAVTTSLDGSLHGDSTVLGWQLLGGADYQLNPTTSLFAEYRYQNAHDVNIGTVRRVGNTSNNLSVGIKFRL
jgi:opacity protein-like surface antigen